MQTPSKKTQSHLTREGHPEFLASCDGVDYDVPGRGNHAEGTSEEVAPPGPTCWCLPLAPSDLSPGTPPGLVMKSPRTASHLPPVPSSAATTQGLQSWGNRQPHPPPLYPSSSTVSHQCITDGHSGPPSTSIMAHNLCRCFLPCVPGVLRPAGRAGAVSRETEGTLASITTFASIICKGLR